MFHHRLKTFTWICAVTLTLAGCAGAQTVAPQGNSAEIRAEQQKQRALAYQGVIDAQTRLHDVAFPILKHNAEFCGARVRGVTGLALWNVDAVPSAYRATAQSLYGLGPDLIVHSTAKKSPARLSGLKKGDVILSINKKAIPRGANALKTARSLLETAGYRNSEVAYIRNGQTKKAILRPVKSCNYPVLLDNSSVINAYADGQRIIVTRGIMRFTENDNELAMVIAHELGHNVMNHVQKLQQNAMTGALGGLAVDALLGAAGVNTGNQFSRLGGSIGQQRFSVAFEQEADYVGMYFLENAGYDSANVANFWRRMAAEGSASIAQRTTHPATAERFIAIERAYQEVQNKKKRNQKLVPNFTPR